jgi:cyanobactin maturation PatA/PatG family protease
MAQTSIELDIVELPGLKELWAETAGDSRISIAVLDGPVDRSHPSLAGANLVLLETLVPGAAGSGPASQHGTHVASVVFGQHHGPVKGIAPGCRGLIVPIFEDGPADTLAPCSQVDLARAIKRAVQAGAQIVNISGGEFSTSGTAHPILADAVQDCSERGILIVAAAGNQGCDCPHVPGALPSVLAVGAMNSKGEPLEFSNWGEVYRMQGVLAPGENVLGAIPGGGTATQSGTSYATAIVSGVASLLLSLQLKRGWKPDPHAIRRVILDTAFGCEYQQVPDCRRVLAGRLNITGAVTHISEGAGTMPDRTEVEEAKQPPTPNGMGGNRSADQPAGSAVESTAPGGTGSGLLTAAPQPMPVSNPYPLGNAAVVAAGSVDPGHVRASTCGCGCGGGSPAQLVYALGQLGFDYGTEARRDSIALYMQQPANPYDPNQLLTYLEKNPWDAASIIWTLNLDATPIYAIKADGAAFASQVYDRLRQFLREQLMEGVERVERVSIPGWMMGNARLFTGQVVPVIHPVLRGMYSWSTRALVKAVCGSPPSKGAPPQDQEAFGKKELAVENFLKRVYEELRNLGVTPQERAINYAATNALQVGKAFEDALKDHMELDAIGVERSPICRPDSDCWDVRLIFFDPGKVFERARKVDRLTVDVSDVVPVMLGPVRSWFVR